MIHSKENMGSPPSRFYQINENQAMTFIDDRINNCDEKQ